MLPSTIDAKLVALVNKRAAAVLLRTQLAGQYRVAAARQMDTEDARGIVQEAAQQTQTETLEALVALVNHCLTAVFGAGAYKLKTTVTPARGKTEISLEFEDSAGNVVSPLDAAGGGVVDVASFALRVASLVIAKPPARRLLVLDEPFKFLSRGHRVAAGELLTTLAEDLSFQIILVTHIPELAIGNVIELQGADADLAGGDSPG